MTDLAALLLACAPLVAQDTARALIEVESGGNPFAIGVVGGALARQPANLPEAVATVAALEAAGWNYSVGLGQINQRNFKHYRLSPKTAFDPCANLHAMQGILGACFARASRRAPQQAALRDALSCYYSGNFLTGHQHGYVGKVLAAWSAKPAAASTTPPPAATSKVLHRVGSVVPTSQPASFTPTHPGTWP